MTGPVSQFFAALSSGGDLSAAEIPILRPNDAALCGLRSAPDILDMQPGKRQRSALHDVVHTFRQAHGFERANSSGYQGTVARYIALEPLLAPAIAAAVDHLSTPAVYADIRQASRMRMSSPPLDDKMLTALCREIRAALIWRQLPKLSPPG